METLFLDRKGVMVVEFMQQRTTITSDVYCETLKELCRAVQNKRHVILISGVVLLHDNVHLHTAACTRALLEHLNWELFDHPPYSPDLTPTYYHLFIYTKN
jgi:transposase